jgi:tetratricopeptide (TPR) repeat protein
MNAVATVSVLFGIIAGVITVLVFLLGPSPRHWALKLKGDPPPPVLTEEDLRRIRQVALRRPRTHPEHYTGTLAASSHGTSDNPMNNSLRSLRKSRNAGDRIGESSELLRAATAFDQNGQPDKALKLYRQALEASRDAEDPAGASSALRAIGLMLWKGRLYKEALNHLQASMEIDLETGDREALATDSLHFGTVLKDKREFDEAEKYYRPALKMARELGLRRVEATALSDLGLVLTEKGNPKEAFGLQKQALAIYEETNDRMGMAHVLENTGRIYKLQGNLDLALEWLLGSLRVLQSIGDSDSGWREAEVGFVLADLYHAMGEDRFVDGCVRAGESRKNASAIVSAINTARGTSHVLG